MKKFLTNIQKIALGAIMATGFMYALTNINVACSAWYYQPQPPKDLSRFKKFSDE